MQIDDYNYAPIGIIALLIIGVISAFAFKKSRSKPTNNRYIKSIRIISVSCVILATSALLLNAIRGIYYSSLPSDIVMCQEVTGTWIIPPVKYVYYAVNVKHGVVKSIDESKYNNEYAKYIEQENEEKEKAQQLLESIGYHIPLSDVNKHIVILDNNIYFSIENDNDELAFFKYDKSSNSIHSNISSQTMQNVLNQENLTEFATLDAYPQIKECISRYETSEVEYGYLLISNQRVIVCLFDNSEKYSVNWLVYEYIPESNNLVFLSKTNSYNIINIIFL